MSTGFGEEIERALLHRIDRVFDRAVGRHDDHWEVGVGFACRLEHFHAAAPWKPEIGEDHGDSGRSETRSCLHGIGCFLDAIALGFERPPQHRSERRPVFDDQHIRAGRPRRGRGVAIGSWPCRRCRAVHNRCLLTELTNPT